MPSDRIDLLACTRDDVIAHARARLATGHGVAAAIHRDAHRHGRFEPERHGLGARAAEAWRRAFTLGAPEPLRRESEATARGTTTEKAVFRLADGLEVESVRIPIGTAKASQCLSSQVGCRQACRFCETGRMGLLRNLSAGEIVGQVVAARTHLGWRPDTLVFQGMGEPLDNVAALAQALGALTDDNGLGFAQRRITVCTAGHVDGLRRLAALGMRRLNMSLSLTFADDAQRGELMPITRRWPLAEVQQALIAMRPRRNWQLGVHWCLMPGLNDSADDARRLAEFCTPLGRVMVHLIPYNPGTRPLCRAPDPTEVDAFIARLRALGLPVRRRITKGRSVMAACGQLGDVGLRRAVRAVAQEA